MPRGITISSFRKLPGGFLIFFGLVLCTELFVYSMRADIIRDFWNKFLINEHVLLEMPGDLKYLVIGDSIQKTGINPAPVDGGLLNLGLPGGKPMSLYLLLDRYLKTHTPPKTVFVYVDPEDPHDSLFVILRYFVNIPELISIFKDLTWRERRIFLMRYWATLDLRQVGLTKRDEYPYDNRTFVADLKKNRGFMPSPGTTKALGDGYFAESGARYQKKVNFTLNDEKYLDKFMKLASSKDIKVVFLGFFMPKELHDILEGSGFNAGYIEFYGNLRKKYPGAYFVDEPILFLENKYFGDPSHVNRNGSAMYTEYFKNQVFLPHREE